MTVAVLRPSRHEIRLVLAFATVIRLATCAALFLLPRFISAFDASATLLLGPSHPLEGFLRWDAVHFARLALAGRYEMEKDYAFMPGIWLVMRWTGRAIAGVRGRALSLEDTILGGVLAANLASIAAAFLLQRLTLTLTSDRRLALTSALLFCSPPAPQTLSVPLTEPFYALFTFFGMTAAAEGSTLLGTLALAAASSFRSNGFLNAGFIVWQLVIQPWRSLSPTNRSRRAFIAGLASLAIALPVLLVQYHAYDRLCRPQATRPWCHKRLPLVYPFVQAHYWDVGFLRYWTLQQSPLFLLSAPVLALASAASYAYYSRSPSRARSLSLPFLEHAKADEAGVGFHSDALLPYIHLSTLLSLILLFASHVQISLRQASTNPVVFWYTAHLLRSRSRWGRRWILYCMSWGAVAVVLWSGFYPPA